MVASQRVGGSQSIEVHALTRCIQKRVVKSWVRLVWGWIETQSSQLDSIGGACESSPAKTGTQSWSERLRRSSPATTSLSLFRITGGLGTSKFPTNSSAFAPLEQPPTCSSLGRCESRAIDEKACWQARDQTSGNGSARRCFKVSPARAPLPTDVRAWIVPSTARRWSLSLRGQVEDFSGDRLSRDFPGNLTHRTRELPGVVRELLKRWRA